MLKLAGKTSGLRGDVRKPWTGSIPIIGPTLDLNGVALRARDSSPEFRLVATEGIQKG